jgi:hypothetical protein
VRKVAISRRLLTAAIASISLLAPAAASADFHEVSIREVYPGAADSSYVMLQMYAPGQGNLAPSHHIDLFGPIGNGVTTFTFANDVPNEQNQATVLVADTGYSGAFPNGPAPDALHAALDIPAAGGAVCFDAPDCVSWGSFSGSLPSAGTPAAPGGIPAGMALRRTIAPGCPTLLEASDDRDNSALDLEAVFPNPRSNSTPPSEVPCGGGGPTGGGSKGQGAGSGNLQTRLVGKPAKVTRDRTPTFRFRSNQRGATFLCKVDGRRFRGCRSPLTLKRLSFGRHVFRVKARSGGEVDPTPATYRFRIVRG